MSKEPINIGDVKVASINTGDRSSQIAQDLNGYNFPVFGVISLRDELKNGGILENLANDTKGVFDTLGLDKENHVYQIKAADGRLLESHVGLDAISAEIKRTVAKLDAVIAETDPEKFNTKLTDDFAERLTALAGLVEGRHQEIKKEGFEFLRDNADTIKSGKAVQYTVDAAYCMDEATPSGKEYAEMVVPVVNVMSIVDSAFNSDPKKVKPEEVNKAILTALDEGGFERGQQDFAGAFVHGYADDYAATAKGLRAAVEVIRDVVAEKDKKPISAVTQATPTADTTAKASLPGRSNEISVGQC